jgi:pyrimidine-nucleoside phosphorylase
MIGNDSFKYVVQRFVEERTESSMHDLVEKVKAQELKDNEIAFLAEKLANSGTIIKTPLAKISADVPSTGGPSSLSTVLCPLFLRMFDVFVPKLGVPGRPAGGIDILAQIPGYKIHFSPAEVVECLKRNGYIHFLADKNYTPLDAMLFAFRKKIGALSLPPLVIASIIAKKLAVGLTNTGLDIRVAPHGNFGSTWNEANLNAHRFCKVSNILGLKSVCFLTDARFPYQPYIGRGEALVALFKIFNGNVGCMLRNHLFQCYSMSLSILDNNKPLKLSLNDLKCHFEENLKAQGSSYAAFEKKIISTQNQHQYMINAHKSGFLKIDLNELRAALVWGQKAFTDRSNKFPDNCGVILKKTTGNFVNKNELLATYRVDKSLFPILKNKIEKAFQVINKLDFSLGFEEVKNV